MDIKTATMCEGSYSATPADEEFTPPPSEQYSGSGVCPKCGERFWLKAGKLPPHALSS